MYPNPTTTHAASRGHREMKMNAPEKPRQSAAPELRIVFLNGSSAPFASHELVSLIFRPRTLWIMCFFTVALSFVSLNPLRSGLPYWATAIMTLMDFILFAVAFTGMLLLTETVARIYRLRWVFEPALTLSACALVGLAAYGLSALIVGESALDREVILLDLLTRALLWEGLVTLYFLFVAPVVPAQTALPDQPPAETGPEMVKLGQFTIDPTQVFRVESDGHYLTIHHMGGEDRILAALSDVALRLGRLGMIVHRSHWVAYREMGRVWRDGRTLRLDTHNAGTVPVSRERVAQVRSKLGEGNHEA
ncbi:MAG: hypothetical protein CFE34_06980 [Rhodobacteraceae bacterium PARR1]|nr:MAG: hypothetical protein CFE34_06980 [Rhodobacteraceae bacterium PARR1]